MGTTPKFLDIHILQTLPPSNINRDDNGRPKTCEYGGTPRMRVSSQAWKKATRDMFGSILDSHELGMRSREFSTMIAKRMNEHPDEETFNLIVGKLLENLSIKEDTQRKGNSGALQFFGNLQWAKIAEIADLAAKSDDPEKTIKEHRKELKSFLDADRSIDIALFGRMTAATNKNEPPVPVDAACQVAHSISVNRAQVETDYLTAVDDCDNESGAGLIDRPGFISSILYRYATIDLRQLSINLAGDQEACRRAVAAFLTAFTQSMPSGKRNSFAPNTLPLLVVTEVRSDRPVSLVEAFEKPIQGDLAAASVAALAAEDTDVETVFGLDKPKRNVSATRHAVDSLPDDWRETVVPFPALVSQTVRDALGE